MTWKLVARALATHCWIHEESKDVIAIEREMFPKLEDASTPWVVKLNQKILFRQKTSELAKERADEYMKQHP